MKWLEKAGKNGHYDARFLLGVDKRVSKISVSDKSLSPSLARRWFDKRS